MIVSNKRGSIALSENVSPSGRLLPLKNEQAAMPDTKVGRHADIQNP
jgi:hypothetical protein